MSAGKATRIYTLVPQIRETIAIDFVDRIKKGNTKSSTFSQPILQRMTTAREDLIRVLESKPDENWNSKVEQRASDYLSLLRGFLDYNPTANPVEVRRPVLEGDGGLQQEAAVQEAHHDDADNSGESKLRNSMYFFWRTSMCADTNEAVRDSIYELVCVLYNVVVATLKEAGRQLARYTPEARKDAYKLLLKAVGIIDFMETSATELERQGHKLPFDVTSTGIKALNSMVRAEVQEVAVASALDKEGKHELVAKLCMGAFEKYKEALQLVSTPTAGAWQDEKLQAWKDYLQLKTTMYEASSYLWSAIVYNKQDQNGRAMKLAKTASHIVEKAKKLAATYSKALQNKEVLMEQVDGLSLLNVKYNDKFDKENQMIYHEKMPEEVPDLLPGQLIGSPEEYQLPEIHSAWTPEEYNTFNLISDANAKKEAQVSTANTSSSAPAQSSNNSNNNNNNNAPIAENMSSQNVSSSGGGGDHSSMTKKQEEAPVQQQQQQQQKKSNSSSSSSGPSLCTIL